MAEYACILQEDQAADTLRDELAEGLRHIGRECFGDGEDGAEITWLTVAPGFGFTAAEPSTSSLVVRSCPEGFPQAEREAFMRKVCDLWSEVTGCTDHEIVVTALDGPLPL